MQNSDASEENLQKDIDSLRKIISDTRVLYDRDECIETLPSIIGQTIFLVLGSGQSDLVDMLSIFPYLDYIYLSEPSHFPYTSQIRGEFPEIKQLLHQLKNDINQLKLPHAVVVDFGNDRILRWFKHSNSSIVIIGNDGTGNKTN
jgi:hypothetical protein